MISGLASAAAQDARQETHEGDDDDFKRLPQSFRRAYERHCNFVWRNLRRLGVPDGDLDDAVQETFVVAYRRRASFRSGASPRGWLYGVVRRIASRFRRGADRRGRLRLAVEGAPEVEHDLGRTLELREAWRLVERFVVALPDDKRDVFVLAELEGMTGNEIATLLQINPNTVGSRLRAGREAFARHLETIAARERGAAVRLERAALLEAGRRAPGPDRQRRSSVGSALALQLGSTSSVGWWPTAAGLRAFLLTVGIGTTSVVVAAIALPEHEQRAPAVPRTEVVSPAPPKPAPPRVAAPAAPASVPSPPEPPPSPAVAPVEVPKPSKPSRREAAADPSDDLFAEAALVKQIKSAVDHGEPAEALRLADDHSRRFSAGKLAIEADALRIIALCRLGRTTDAARIAAAVKRAAPHHPGARGCPEENPTRPAAAGEGGGI